LQNYQVKNFIAKFFLIIFFCCFSLTTPVWADVVKFELGGATDGPGICPKNRFIIEEQFFDYQRNFNHSKNFQYDLSSTKIRYGLIQDKLELRILNQGFIIRDSDAGFSNMSIGAKMKISDEHKYIPSLDLITDFEIPVGEKDLRNPGFDHSYKLVINKQWSKKIGSTANTSFDFATKKELSEVKTNASLPYALNINYSPNERINYFSHIFGSWAISADALETLGVDLGASYAFSDDLAIVGWISKGLNSQTPEIMLDFGLIFRP
jgi:hypothetical protein